MHHVIWVGNQYCCSCSRYPLGILNCLTRYSGGYLSDWVSYRSKNALGH